MTAILGGGLAGLSASFYGLQNPKIGPMVVLEASNRVGGWIRSLKSPKTKATFEQGPRTIRFADNAGKNTLELMDRLQLTDKILPIRRFHPAASNRKIFVNGKLHAMPSNFKAFFQVNQPFERSFFQILIKELFAPRVKVDDESVYDFVKRRCGQDVADYAVSPLLCGICAGDAKQISIKSFAKQVFEIEQKHGSIVKGLFLERFLKEKVPRRKKDAENLFDVATTDSAEAAKKQNWAVWSLEGGLELVPKTLASTLRSFDVNIRLNSPCEQLDFRQGQAVVTVNNKTEIYKRVISALPGKSIARLLRRQHPQLAVHLEAIPMTTVGLVNLEFSGDLIDDPAFGFLVAPIENKPILGVTFDTCLFPNDSSSTVLTVMMGGAWYDKYFGESATEADLLHVALEEVKGILEIDEKPISHHVSILKDCIPQYVVGHSDRLRAIESYILSNNLPLHLCGSSYHGVGINDVILSAKTVAEGI